MHNKDYIPFNKPYMTGNEAIYMKDAVMSGKISGNGLFTNKCQNYFEKNYGFKKCLLTTSCTDALEMTAMLAEINESDEVIIPSYTFVSTALAFIRQGARILFADSGYNNPNIDVSKIEELITDRTKAIVVVHYAGVACDMDSIMSIAEKYNILVIEDAAQAIDSYYKGRPLGSIGHMGCFSFHETKNIISGEGGMLVINDDRFLHRSEIIWEKGTNRAEFFRGEVNKYGWVDIGSSFLPSEIIAAFLWAQIENLEKIQVKRKKLWDLYYSKLSNISKNKYFKIPEIPDYASNNAHMFYIVCRTIKERTDLIDYLKENNILSVFHYLSLHDSLYYRKFHDGRDLVNSDHYSNCLIRLPLFYELTIKQVCYIVNMIQAFFNEN